MFIVMPSQRDFAEIRGDFLFLIQIPSPSLHRNTADFRRFFFTCISGILIFALLDSLFYGIRKFSDSILIFF